MAFVLFFPLIIGLCRVTGPQSRQEEFEHFERWQAQRLEEEKSLYRH